MTHNAENLAKDQSTQPQLDATGKIMQIKA